MSSLVLINEKQKITPLISIVLACINSHDFFIKIIKLFNDQTFKNFELIVADNASDIPLNNSLKNLKYEFNINIIRFDKNIGFAAGINQCVSKAQSDIIIVLNVDISFSLDFLEKIYNNLNYTYKNILLASFHIKNFFTKETESYGVYLTSFLRAKNSTKKEHYIIGPHGAGFVFRKKLLEHIKTSNGSLFDERYFFLWEDIELGLRCLSKDINTLIMDDIVCYHCGNASKSNYYYKQYLSMRNRKMLINTYFKNYFLKYLHAFIFYDIPRFIFFLIFNPFRLKYIREVLD